MNGLREINGLKPTEAMTFPRSGHHWLFEILAEYFGQRLVVAEPHPESPPRIEDSDKTNFQRCFHDWSLTEPIRDDRQYLVQIRDPVDALASRWALEHRPEGIEAWYSIMGQWIDYYSGFMKKWVYSRIPNRLIVRYSDLFTNLPAKVCEIVCFMESSGLCDGGRIHKICEAHPVVYTGKGNFNGQLN